MHRVLRVDGDGARMHGIGGLLVIDVAGRDPPGPRDHIRVALLVVKMRLGEIARIPLDDDAIESRLAGIAEQRTRLVPAFLAAPLDVLWQDSRNMGWIGQWAHRVVDGCLGALRMGDSGKNGGADTRADDGTQNNHSGQTHACLLPANAGHERGPVPTPTIGRAGFPHAPIMTPEDEVLNIDLQHGEVPVASRPRASVAADSTVRALAEPGLSNSL